MRILLLSPDYRFSKAIGSELFRDEIAKQHEVVRVVGPAELNPTKRVDVRKLLDEHGGGSSFDLVMVHHLQFSQQYNGIAGLSIPTCCWMVDYFPRHYDYKFNILTKHAFNLIFVTQQSFVCPVLHHWWERTPSVRWLPFSVDPVYFFQSADKPRALHYTALFSAHAFEYPDRAEVVEQLVDFRNRNKKLKYYVKLVESPADGVYHKAYARLLGTSMIGVASLDQHGSCNMRHFEIPMAGALLVTDGPPNDFDALGFKEGEHYVRYEQPYALQQTLKYYLEHPDERLRIARAGQELVLKHHTNQVRVQEMTRTIEEVLFGGKT